MKIETRSSHKDTAGWIGLLAVALLAASLLLVGCGRSDSASRLDSPATASTSPVSSETLAQFEAKLESLREVLKIPGISAAVVRDGELVWSKGFGFADLENGVEATANTPYGLASVTKPFAAFLLMKLVEDGRLDLDAPASEFGIDLGNEAITVRHLFSHTSEGIPGSRYQYSGNRYSMLTTVIDQLHAEPFRRVLRQETLAPLGMNDSALNYGGCGLSYYLSGLPAEDPERAFEHVYRESAVAYLYDDEYEVYPASIPSYANAAAGLISTVVDLARFAAAIERDALVAPETRELMFSPTKLNSGADGPYGLGWFTETHGDTRLVWHYGYGAYSSLFLMVPSEKLTFIVLANSQNLSRPFGLGGADVSVLASPMALAFFKQFVMEPRYGERLPEIDWEADRETLANQLARITDPELRELYSGELWTYRKLHAGVGRDDVASRLLTAHAQSFPEFSRSTGDMYRVERPGPRPAEADQIPLTDDEATRWIGRYRLRSEDAGSGLPPEIEVGAYGDLIIATDSGGGCQELLVQTPIRLVAADNPNLFLVAEGDEGPFTGAEAEYEGVVIGTYERVD